MKWLTGCQHPSFRPSLWLSLPFLEPFSAICWLQKPFTFVPLIPFSCHPKLCAQSITTPINSLYLKTCCGNLKTIARMCACYLKSLLICSLRISGQYKLSVLGKTEFRYRHSSIYFGKIPQITSQPFTQTWFEFKEEMAAHPWSFQLPFSQYTYLILLELVALNLLCVWLANFDLIISRTSVRKSFGAYQQDIAKIYLHQTDRSKHFPIAQLFNP